MLLELLEFVLGKLSDRSEELIWWQQSHQLAAGEPLTSIPISSSQPLPGCQQK